MNEFFRVAQVTYQLCHGGSFTVIFFLVFSEVLIWIKTEKKHKFCNTKAISFVGEALNMWLYIYIYILLNVNSKFCGTTNELPFIIIKTW